MINQCEFCGARIGEAAGFCGTCGRVPSRIAQRPTRISDVSTLQVGQWPVQGDDNRTMLSAWEKDAPSRTPSGSLHPVTLLPIEQPDNEDEDERRRGAALLGLALPLAGEIASYPTAGPAPLIQGTPPIAHVPTVAGTPPLAHMPAIAGTPPIAPGGSNLPFVQGNPPALPHMQPPQPLPPPPVRQPGGQPGGQPGNSSGTSSPNPGGCFPLGVLISLATILVILAVSAGLGLTVFAPGLSLSGNTTVAAGDNLIIHGHNFFPNSSVTLTLDGGTPLFFTQSQNPTRLTGQAATRTSAPGLVLASFLATASRNDIPTHGDGTFTATIQIQPTWTAGEHTIHATEAVSHRNASLSFKITQANLAPTATPDNTSPTPGTTPTATPSTTPGTTPTATPTATPTVKPTATPTPSPTPAPPRLSCANPGNLTLGPVGEFTSQTVSADVTLCTTGSGTLTWRASWDQGQAPWLQISQNNGSVQAPNQVQLTLSASATGLGAGTYSTTVTFLGVESNTTQTINVTLQVQAGCISSSPSSLSFTGIDGLRDPAGPQTVTLTNCGLAGNWSATIKNGSNWLSLDTSGGTLAAGATQTITVTASNLKAKLTANTYKDSIIFTIGSNTTTVSVLLTVQTQPITISANPTALDSASSPCKNGDNSVCVITLTNTSSVAADWSATPSGKGVTVQAASTTISAGGTEQVTIIVALSNCGTPVTIAFTAQGGNTVTVTWNCTPVIG